MIVHIDILMIKTYLGRWSQLMLTAYHDNFSGRFAPNTLGASSAVYWYCSLGLKWIKEPNENCFVERILWRSNQCNRISLRVKIKQLSNIKSKNWTLDQILISLSVAIRSTKQFSFGSLIHLRPKLQYQYTADDAPRVFGVKRPEKLSW